VIVLIVAMILTSSSTGPSSGSPTGRCAARSAWPADLGDRHVRSFCRTSCRSRRGHATNRFADVHRHHCGDEGNYDVTVSYKQIAIWVVTASCSSLLAPVSKTRSDGRNVPASRTRRWPRCSRRRRPHDLDHLCDRGRAAAVRRTLYLTIYGVVALDDGFVPGVKAFTAAVLGGIGSLPGAVLGGLLIGVIETLWAEYVSSAYKGCRRLLDPGIVMISCRRHPPGRPDVEKV